MLQSHVHELSQSIQKVDLGRPNQTNIGGEKSGTWINCKLLRAKRHKRQKQILSSGRRRRQEIVSCVRYSQRTSSRMTKGAGCAWVPRVSWSWSIVTLSKNVISLEANSISFSINRIAGCQFDVHLFHDGRLSFHCRAEQRIWRDRQRQDRGENPPWAPMILQRHP